MLVDLSKTTSELLGDFYYLKSILKGIFLTDLFVGGGGVFVVIVLSLLDFNFFSILNLSSANKMTEINWCNLKNRF